MTMENKVNVKPLEQDLIDALQEKEQEGIQLLQITEGENPKQTVQNIRTYVDKLLEENHSEDELREYALQLGTIWGIMVIKKYGWTWKYLDFGDDIHGIYLVSPKEYYCCPPLYFLNKILLSENTGLDGNNDNTVMLLFNMLEGIENRKPKSKFQVIS